MIEQRRAADFSMTPAQHRQWARLLHAKGKPEKAQRHELLARAIEIRDEQQQAACPTVGSPPIAPKLCQGRNVGGA
jgi:hypothetical protein